MPWRTSWTTTSARGRGWRPDPSKAGGREGAEGARGWNPTGNGTRGMVVVGGPGGARAGEGREVEEGREVSWEEREEKEVIREVGGADRKV